MKKQTTLLKTATFAFVLAPWIPGQAIATAQEAEATTSERPTVAEEFHFRGGTPREFLEAIEKHYNEERWEVWSDAFDLITDEEIRAEYEDYGMRMEAQSDDFLVDWLTIAEIPDWAASARVPTIRMEWPLPVIVHDEVGVVISHVAQGPRVRGQLEQIVALYNRLGERNPALGELVIEGDLHKPSVVMLVAKGASRQEIAGPAGSIARPGGLGEYIVRAFPIRGIRESEWDSLSWVLRISQEEAMESERARLDELAEWATVRMGVQEAMQTERARIDGNFGIHSAAGVLVATGTEAYVEMVESVVAAYRENESLMREN